MGIVVNRTRLNPFPVKSASGEFISIDDAVDRPVKKLEISFTPNQEGSGDPSVGGTNYFPSNFVWSSDTTIIYTPINVGDGEFTMSTPNYPYNSTQDVFFLAGDVGSGASSGTNGVGKGHPITVTSVNGYVTVANRYDSAREQPSQYAWYIQASDSVQNIRPIHGYTGLTVADDSRYGGFIDWNQLITNGNFANGTTGWRASTLGALIASDGILTLYATSSSNRSWAVGTDATFISGHTYVLLGGFRRDYTGTDSDSKTWRLRAYGNVEQRIKTLSTPSAGSTAVMDCVFMATDNNSSFGAIPSSGGIKPPAGGLLFSVWNVQLFDITQMFGEEIADSIYEMEQAEAGSGVAYFKNIFPHDYYDRDEGGILTCASAVNGDPYWVVSVSWQTEAGTVMGGTLNLLTGVLIANWTLVTFDGTESWISYGSGARTYFRHSLGAYGTIAVSGQGLCSTYPWYDITGSNTGVGFSVISSSGFNADLINIRPNNVDGMTATIFKEMLAGWYANGNPCTVAYKMKNPVTYQLDSHQISTLMGSNRIWTDVGTISLDYRALRSAPLGNGLLGGMLGNPSVPDEPEEPEEEPIDDEFDEPEVE